MTFPPDPNQPPNPYQQPQAGPPYPQFAGPVQPVPAKKKSRTGLIIGIIAGVVVLCCGGGAIIAAVSSKTVSTVPAAAASPASTVTVSVPSTVPTTAAAAPTTEAAAPAPKTLLTLKGNGIKKSQIFTTSDEWPVAYTFDCSNFGSEGNFAVTEYDGQGGIQDILVNQLQKKGSDSVPVHASSGAHYLEVNSECGWSLTVVG